MKEDDVLAGLRDIHLPESAQVETAAGFALWPFIVLGVLVAIVLSIRLWRASAWRRAGRRELATILGIEDSETRWSRLLHFASGLSTRSGRNVDLPDLAFQRPDSLNEGRRAELVRFLTAELRR